LRNFTCCVSAEVKWYPGEYPIVTFYVYSKFRNYKTTHTNTSIDKRTISKT